MRGPHRTGPQFSLCRGLEWTLLANRLPKLRDRDHATVKRGDLVHIEVQALDVLVEIHCRGFGVAGGEAFGASGV